MKKKKNRPPYCTNYLAKKEQFKWFIERYFGLKKYIELWDLAEEGYEHELKSELDAIWHELPASIFNAYNNTPGWETFLTFVENR